MALLDRFRSEPVRIEPLRIWTPEVFPPVQRVKVEADVLPRRDLEAVQLDGFGVVPADEGNHRTQSERFFEDHFGVLQLAERVLVDCGMRAGKHLADLGDHLGLVLGVHGKEEARVGDGEGGGVVALGRKLNLKSRRNVVLVTVTYRCYYAVQMIGDLFIWKVRPILSQYRQNLIQKI